MVVIVWYLGCFCRAILAFAGGISSGCFGSWSFCLRSLVLSQHLHRGTKDRLDPFMKVKSKE